MGCQTACALNLYANPTQRILRGGKQILAPPLRLLCDHLQSEMEGRLPYAVAQG
jgi:hypothetical protein